MAIDRPDWSGTELVPAESNLPTSGYLPVEVYSNDGYRADDAFAPPMLADPPSIASILDGLPAGLVESWDNDGAGAGFRLQQAQGAVIAILENLPADAQEELVSSFDWLPQSAQAAIFQELALGSAASVLPATDGQIAEYAETAAGALVVAAWGGRAPRNGKGRGTRVAHVTVDER